MTAINWKRMHHREDHSIAWVADVGSETYFVPVHAVAGYVSVYRHGFSHNEAIGGFNVCERAREMATELVVLDVERRAAE